MRRFLVRVVLAAQGQHIMEGVTDVLLKGDVIYVCCSQMRESQASWLQRSMSCLNASFYLEIVS